MIDAHRWWGIISHKRPLRMGTAGHLAILAWSLAMVMLVPAQRIHWAAALCLGVAVLVYPLSLKRLLRVRWLVLLAMLALPPVLLLGQVDTTVLGLGLRSEGLRAGLQIAARFVVVMVAVDGFTSAVDIAAIAGLLERLGLQGLGFCLGVALNLLPALQESARHAWHSLWLRGGFRRQWGRALRLLLVTVVGNALRRAEEIALAAEARAFSPDCARPMPILVGRLDWLATALAAVALIGFCLVR
jgi:energy-coupling factor transporter transmembrane protein EcfT